MGILFRLVRTLIFAAAILALAEVNVAGKRIGAHVTSGVAVLWKSGPGRWISKGVDSLRWDWSKKALAKLELPAPPKHAKERTVREDVGERDRARLQSLLENESP